MFYIFYSFFYFGMGVLFTFLTVFFTTETPLVASEVTTMMSFVPIISFVSSNLFAYVSDKTKKHKTVLMTSMLLTLASSLVLAQMVSVDQVFIIIGAYCLFSFFFPAPGTLTESFTLQYAKEKNIPYGRIRLFGSIGYAIAGYVAGYLTDQFGLAIIFYVFAFCIFIPMLFVPKFPEIEETIEHEFPEQNTKIYSQLFSNKQFLTIMLCSFFILASMQTTNNFFGIYITQHTNLGLRFLGLMTLISAGTEIPMMFFSNTLIEKFGVYKILALSSLLNSIRFAAYFLFPIDWVIILVTLTHGIGYGSAFTSIMYLLGRDIPAKIRSSAISLNTSFAIGIGNSIITFLGSQWFDAQSVYLCLAVLEAVGLILCLSLVKRNSKVSIEENLEAVL